MKLIDEYDEHGAEVFESPDHIETEDLRDMVIGYVKAADRDKLAQMIALCRDLFFER